MSKKETVVDGAQKRLKELMDLIRLRVDDKGKKRIAAEG
jgi:hypothetical protein